MTRRGLNPTAHAAFPGRMIRVRRAGCEPILLETHPTTTAAIATWVLSGTWPTFEEWDRMTREREAVVL